MDQLSRTDQIKLILAELHQPAFLPSPAATWTVDFALRAQ